MFWFRWRLKRHRFQDIGISSDKYELLYSLIDPGWLSDNIIDAYISLLVEAASKKGIRVKALNCFFYTRLKNLPFTFELQMCYIRELQTPFWKISVSTELDSKHPH